MKKSKLIISEITYFYDLNDGFRKLELNLEPNGQVSNLGSLIDKHFKNLESRTDRTFCAAKKEKTGHISHFAGMSANAGYAYKHGDIGTMADCEILYCIYRPTGKPSSGSIKITLGFTKLKDSIVREQVWGRIWETYDYVLENYMRNELADKQAKEIAWLRQRAGQVSPQSLLAGEDKSILSLPEPTIIDLRRAK